MEPSPKDHRPDLQAKVIINAKASEHYENGEEAMAQSRFEKAVTCFSKAINLQPKQTQLYVSQGEAYLQMCDFQSAAVCYKQACILEPGLYHIRLAFIYYLQGQCLYDQGMFLDALESFAKAAEIKPCCRAYHIRSLACLTAVGRYSDCLLLVTSWLEEDEDSQKADLYTLRARLYKQLNQMTSCYCDLKAALALNPACPQASGLLAQLVEVSEAARLQAVSKALIGELPGALENITKALEHSPEKEEIYLFRGTLYRRLKDFTAAIDDLVLAIELSEGRVAHQRSLGAQNQSTQEELRSLQKDAQNQLVLTYNDFAVQVFSRGYYTEATMLLTKAIQDQKDESGLYINRGDCFFKQAEWQFALADYQQAEEMSPDDHAIWVRLAIIHNTLGMHSYQERKYQEAVDRLSEAIRHNPGVALYYENRARAYQKIPNMEKARQDAICTLVLDPTNDQATLPHVLLLDVLSSETGSAVRAQLMDHIQAYKNRTPSSATSGLDKTNLNQDERIRRVDRQSEEQSEEEELLPCVVQWELNQQMAHSVLQVKRAVRLALQCRQPLWYTGPRLAPVRAVEQEKPALSSVETPYSWRKFGGLGFNFT
ncbi:tetratricopeptide repeat protein 16-like [Aplochiton taeniatus]